MISYQQSDSEKNWKELDAFHARVDSICRALGRFTTVEFRRKFGFISPLQFGYKSLEDVFVMRGCECEGGDNFAYKGILESTTSNTDNQIYYPPKFPSKMSLVLTISFHSAVDVVIRELKRFSQSEFEWKLSLTGVYKVEDYGYFSWKHLLTFRGCLREGEEYFFDDVFALKAKTLIVANYLEEFTEGHFMTTFRRFYRTKNILNRTEFLCIDSLIKSAPGIRSVTTFFGDVSYYFLRSNDPTRFLKPIGMGVLKTPAQLTDEQTRVREFNKFVDASLELLKRFRERDFVEKMGTHLTLDTFGYGSVKELLETRGCLCEGDEFVYDRVLFLQRKAVNVAAKLRIFTAVKFARNFDSDVNSYSLKNNPKMLGFRTYLQFLPSLPSIETISRSGEYVKFVYHGPKSTTTDEETQISQEKKILYENILNVARELRNPFSEGEFYESFSKRYNLDPTKLSRAAANLIPVFLETVSGIDYIGEGNYRHDGGAYDSEHLVDFVANNDKAKILLKTENEKRLRLHDEETSDDEPVTKKRGVSEDREATFLEYISKVSGLNRGESSEIPTSIREQQTHHAVSELMARAPKCNNDQSSQVVACSSAASTQSAIGRGISELMGTLRNELLDTLVVGAIERNVEPVDLGKKLLKLLDQNPQL